MDSGDKADVKKQKVDEEEENVIEKTNTTTGKTREDVWRCI